MLNPTALEPAPPGVPNLTATTALLSPRQVGSGLVVGGHALSPFTIDSKPLFDLQLSGRKFVTNDLSFANNFIWTTRMSAFYGRIDGCFCLFSLNGNQLTMLLPPLGAVEPQQQALVTCFDIMDSYNGGRESSQVEYVSGEWVQAMGLESAAAASQWRLESSFADYLYHTNDLIELRGNSYKTKRSEINQFTRAYPDHRVEVLGPEHHDGIRDLFNTWLQQRLAALDRGAIGSFVSSIELERQGIERALRHYTALGLSGLCLLIDGRVEGFTFGERLNGEVASVLVEKTNFAIDGAAQFLFREFAKGFADCTYLNVGDDLGLESMRRVKMSYRPVLFGDKFTLRRAASA